MYEFIVRFSAQYLLYIIAAVALVWWITQPKKEKLSIAIFGALALFIAFVLLLISAKFYYDTRPFIVLGITPLFPHSPDNGFPSDHTILAMTIAFVVTFFDRRVGTILILLSVVLGVSRVLAYIHHPIDIIASTALAAIAVLLTAGILKLPVVTKFLKK